MAGEKDYFPAVRRNSLVLIRKRVNFSSSAAATAN